MITNVSEPEMKWWMHIRAVTSELFGLKEALVKSHG